MATTERSPKKRRVDLPDSQSVAQANSTAQSFLRTKQFRWMQPGAAASSPPTTTQQAGITAYDVPKPRAGPTNTRSGTLDDCHDSSRSGEHALPVSARSSAQSPVGAPLELQTRRPATIANPLTTRRTTTRRSCGQARPGLPSPALSNEEDERFSSPRFATAAAANGNRGDRVVNGTGSTSTTARADTTSKRIPSRANGFPEQDTSTSLASIPSQRAGDASNDAATAQESNPDEVAQHHLHLNIPIHAAFARGSARAEPSTTSANILHSPASYQGQDGGLARTHDHVYDSTALTTPAAHLQLRTTAADVLQQHPALTPQALHTRLQQVEARSKLCRDLKAFDIGRLALLRNAVYTQDWFYLALSQIHCLSTKRDLLPEPVQNLGPNAFAGLDVLFLASTSINSTVRDDLCNFPLPIMTIYSSPFVARPYNTLVNAVVAFMNRLNAHWTAFLTQCNQSRAPPLVSDLFNTFGLTSRLVQSAAFRAILRINWTDPLSIEQAERLHTMDQNYFFTQPPPTQIQLGHMYRAFLELHDCCVQHAAQIKIHKTRQRFLPAHQRLPPPAFQLPASILTPFQPHVPEAHLRLSTDRHAGVVPQQGLLQQSRQEQSMAIDTRLKTIPHPGQSSNAAASQTLATMAERPTQPLAQAFVISLPPQKQPPGPHLVFPHVSEQPRAQPTHPDTTRCALHQAHLRSPKLTSAKIDSGGPHLYRHVLTYAMHPSRLDQGQPINTFVFTATQSALDNVLRIPKQITTGEPACHALTEATQMARLRCCAFGSVRELSESDWVCRNTVWPPQLYLEMNGIPLEPRKKLHHGRHLPIDVGRFLKAGENTLTAMITRMSTDTSPFDFLLAVEIVGVSSHDTIVKNVTASLIPAETSRTAIRHSLSCATDPENNDDDVAITINTLTVSLFDPYSASTMFTIPVRGSECKHRDCFDLETFLNLCKRSYPADLESPTVVDCWRCPICRGDVRPQKMIVDGLLVEVRKELEAMGKLDTRAVLFNSEGNWKVKMQEHSGIRSESREPRDGDRLAGFQTMKNAVEIIELE